MQGEETHFGRIIIWSGGDTSVRLMVFDEIYFNWFESQHVYGSAVTVDTYSNGYFTINRWGRDTRIFVEYVICDNAQYAEVMYASNRLDNDVKY